MAGLKVSWYPPLQVNGAITGYKIIYAKTGVAGVNQSISAGSSVNTVNINGLEHYTNYTILVRAFTRQGEGEWSSPVKIQTHEGSKFKFSLSLVSI